MKVLNVVKDIFFGNQNNLIRFRLNNDGSVSKMLISVPNGTLSKYPKLPPMLVGMGLGISGMDKSERDLMYEKFTNTVLSVSQNGKNSFHEKVSGWCSRNQCYIVMDVEFNLSKMDFYFYAYK